MLNPGEAQGLNSARGHVGGGKRELKGKKSPEKGDFIPKNGIRRGGGQREPPGKGGGNGKCREKPQNPPKTPPKNPEKRLEREKKGEKKGEKSI